MCHDSFIRATTQESTLLKTHLSSLLYSEVYERRKCLSSLLYSEVYFTENTPQQFTLLKTYLNSLLY